MENRITYFGICILCGIEYLNDKNIVTYNYRNTLGPVATYKKTRFIDLNNNNAHR